MPPRPRPRPKAHTTPSQPSGSSPAAISLQLPTEEDEDRMFLRNTNLTTQTWKNLNKRSEEAVIVVDDSNASSPRKNRRTSVPKWTLPQTKAGLKLTNDDEDKFDDLYADDSDIEIVETSLPMEVDRRRSRSKSITPPPELTFAQLQNAKSLVRHALGARNRRVNSSQNDDDSLEVLASDQDPVLQAASSSSSDDGPPVSIKVHWKPHPTDKTGQSQVLNFTIRRNDTFRQVFDETADAVSIPYNDLVLSYQDKRLYPSTTPAGMSIWTEGELGASSKSTYDYMRANNIRFSKADLRSPSPVAPGSDYESEKDSDEEMTEPSQGGSDTFKITLRSSKTKDIVLTVRPSTKCGAIVKAFLKKAGLADKYLQDDPKATGKDTKKRGRKSLVLMASGPCLMVDGDKIKNESEICDTELEDGDMVEVVGL